MKKKIKVLRKTVYQRKLIYHSMKTTRRINYYMTKEGTLLTKISSNFPIKEYYNENGDIEMVRSKHNSKIIIFNYNKDGNIKSTNNIDTNSDNTIKSNLTSILSYDNDGKISKMELKYHHFDNNNVHESTVHYQYTDTEKIVYDGKLKEIYTLDNRLKESILPGRIIQYTYDNNGRKISKKVITKYDGSIRNYTYEYSDNSCIERVENGEIIKYLLNDNDNIIECRDGNDELIYKCEYEYYED